MVYASNQPSQFDPAILDRIDEMVEFGLPAESERREMIASYVDRYLIKPPAGARTRKVVVDGVGPSEIEEAVKLTEGFSGRAISKLAIAWQAAAYGTEGAVLDRESFFEVIDEHRSSASTKDSWLRGGGGGGGEGSSEASDRARLLTADAPTG